MIRSHFVCECRSNDAYTRESSQPVSSRGGTLKARLWQAMIVMAAVLTSTQAEAQMRYVDEKGVTHWVSSEEQIPPQYRNKAEAPGLPSVNLRDGAPRSTSPARPKDTAKESQQGSGPRMVLWGYLRLTTRLTPGTRVKEGEEEEARQMANQDKEQILRPNQPEWLTASECERLKSRAIASIENETRHKHPYAKITRLAGGLTVSEVSVPLTSVTTYAYVCLPYGKNP